MKTIRTLLVFILTIIMPSYGLAGNAADYLILSTIGQYQFVGKGKGSQSSGILSVTDHFDQDHADESYRGSYIDRVQKIGVKINVTKHTGSDSDKWLRHEVDREFRTYYGIPDPSYIIKTIDGNTIYTFGSAGWDYRWVSGNKVIMIEYHDIQMSKPEPLEVVMAYLAKHPSTLPAITMNALYSSANKTTWIKDEMDRRLWLCDKWFLQITLKKAEEKQVYQESIKSMNVFLDYREKYYGIKAADEKNLLASYLNTNNGTGIKTKLTEYKNWWTVNKGKSISVP